MNKESTWIYRPRPADLVGGFLLGAGEVDFLIFFSMLGASSPSMWCMPFFFSNAALIVSLNLLIVFPYFWLRSLESNQASGINSPPPTPCLLDRNNYAV